MVGLVVGPTKDRVGLLLVEELLHGGWKSPDRVLVGGAGEKDRHFFIHTADRESNPFAIVPADCTSVVLSHSTQPIAPESADFGARELHQHPLHDPSCLPSRAQDGPPAIVLTPDEDGSLV